MISPTTRKITSNKETKLDWQLGKTVL